MPMPHPRTRNIPTNPHPRPPDDEGDGNDGGDNNPDLVHMPEPEHNLKDPGKTIAKALSKLTGFVTTDKHPESPDQKT